MRPDLELDPVADRRVPGPPDADDPPVLDPDVGLDDPDRRIDDDGARDDEASLAVDARPIWVIRGRSVLA